MMEKKMPEVGFIGGGAMAEALISGLISCGRVAAEKIHVSDHKDGRCRELEDKYGVQAQVGAEGFVSEVDVLILAVKPQAAEKAMSEISSKVRTGTIVVSIVAGLSLQSLEKIFPLQPVVRVMPNTPLSVGEGMSALACGTRVDAGTAGLVRELFAAGGRALLVDEKQMDAVTGLSGSGPAYAFLMIDALADGGVAAGLKRSVAIELAAQTLLGAARMVLSTGRHPDELRDQVTSPAGTTIAGVRVLEEKGLRGALLDAVLAASDRSRELDRQSKG